MQVIITHFRVIGRITVTSIGGDCRDQESIHLGVCFTKKYFLEKILLNEISFLVRYGRNTVTIISTMSVLYRGT